MKHTPLSSDPEKTREWLRRGRRKSAESLARSRSPLQRKKGLASRGKRYRREVREGKRFSALWECVKGMPCLICGADYTEAAHVKPTGRGYGDRLDNGDGNLVPLCPGHHDEADGRVVGHGGRSEFEAEYAVDLEAEAKRLADEG